MPQIPAKYRGWLYVVLAIAMTVSVVLGAITPEQLNAATQDAMKVAEAIANALAALALVLARLNLTPDE